MATYQNGVKACQNGVKTCHNGVKACQNGVKTCHNGVKSKPLHFMIVALVGEVFEVSIGRHNNQDALLMCGVCKLSWLSLFWL